MGTAPYQLALPRKHVVLPMDSRVALMRHIDASPLPSQDEHYYTN